MTASLGIYEGLNLPVIVLPVGLAHRLDGNLVAAAMLAQMAFLSSISRGDDGWFDIPMQGVPSDSAGNLYDRCGSWRYMLGAGERALRDARRRLIDLGFLNERLAGVPARLRYKVNLERYREFLDDRVVRAAEVGNRQGTTGGLAEGEEELPLPQDGPAGDAPGQTEAGSSEIGKDACSSSADRQTQGDDVLSTAVGPEHDAPPRGDLNEHAVDTNPKTLPQDVPNPLLRAPGEEGSTGSALTARHAELIAVVAGEAGCSAEALEDAFRDRVRDKKSGGIGNPEAWLRSVGRRLAQGEALSWGQAAAQERSAREARAKELDEQIRAREREKSPRNLADPTHVARCIDAMPWAKRPSTIKLHESRKPPDDIWNRPSID